jgi:hypothetical protein
MLRVPISVQLPIGSSLREFISNGEYVGGRSIPIIPTV